MVKEKQGKIIEVILKKKTKQRSYSEKRKKNFINREGSLSGRKKSNDKGRGRESDNKKKKKKINLS